MKSMQFTSASRAAIRDVKDRVAAMLAERQQLGTSEQAEPSSYWSAFCSAFDYLPGMADESFAKLRLHTYHLTGDNYQTYFFRQYEEQCRKSWDELIRHTPKDLILSEPMAGGIGFEFDGRIVSQDLMRFQTTVNSLDRQGVIGNLNEKGERVFVLEIGAGYGGLASHLMDKIQNATYFIIDLPEVLLFSASYLSLVHPNKSSYIYDEKDYSEIIDPVSARKFDFIFLPNFRLKALNDLKFDMAFNLASLQEMKTQQAIEYLDFIAEHVSCFYSWNQDRQPENKELKNLTELLQERFDIIPLDAAPVSLTSSEPPPQSSKQKIRSLVRRLAVLLGLADPLPKTQESPRHESDYREYLCHPRVSGVGDPSGNVTGRRD